MRIICIRHDGGLESVGELDGRRRRLVIRAHSCIDQALHGGCGSKCGAERRREGGAKEVLSPEVA